MSSLTPGAAGAPTSDFVGRGFAWPMGVDHTGSIALTAQGGDLEDSIRMVLLTAPGERLMRPQFGCRIWDLLFEPVNANLIGLISQAVRDALAQWEPRIEVDEVTPVRLTRQCIDNDIGRNFNLHRDPSLTTRSPPTRRSPSLSLCSHCGKL